MILVLLVVCGAVFFWSYIEDWHTSQAISGIAVFLSFICTIALVIGVSRGSVIEKRIEMYSQENTAIQQQIADAVARYQEYEGGVFSEIAPESSITLVTLYPELKSDTLVASQIRNYVSNSTKIKELKDGQILLSVNRWWLYFGH